MPVRVRITLIFSLLVFIILAIVCSGIYYFSYQNRIKNIKARLTNRAITTGRLLSQREIFDRELLRRIDSSTTISYKRKIVEAFNYQNKRIYKFSDQPNDSISASDELLNNARVNGKLFFKEGDREVVAYHYTDNDSRVVLIVAGEDFDGKESLRNLSEILLLGFLVGNIIVLIG